MSRILFFLVIAAIIYVGIVYAKRTRVRGDEDSDVAPKSGKGKGKKSPVAMIKCPECGTFFAQDEAVMGDGKRYCSEKCRKASRRDRA